MDGWTRRAYVQDKKEKQENICLCLKERNGRRLLKIPKSLSLLFACVYARGNTCQSGKNFLVFEPQKEEGEEGGRYV
jgi:hypothetical protein